jgi:hypothetical protein
MNSDMVRPNRSCVYFWLSTAISSRNGAAAGEIRAIKSSTEQCSFLNALRTSVAVLECIFSVISFHDNFSISSENIVVSHLEIV